MSRCDECRKSLTKQGFSTSRWHNKHDHSRRMICLRCEAVRAVHACAVCESLQAEEEYTDSIWHHRKERPAVCKKCQASAAPQVHQCILCEEEHPAEQYTESMWHNRRQQPAVCKKCETAQRPRRRAVGLDCDRETLQCYLCREAFTSEGFTQGMWKHRGEADRHSYCQECCRPPCTNPACTTCTTCRDPECKKRRQCEGKPVALHPKSLPKRMDELETWLCAKCKPTFCSHWPQCRKKRNSKKAPAMEQYTCGECAKALEE